MMGELAASLAHEIKQPIAAAQMDAETCLRWLRRDTPDVAEACEAASRMVNDATRATEIIDRVRSLYRQDTSNPELLDVNEIIREMITAARQGGSEFHFNPHRARLRASTDHSGSRTAAAGINEPDPERHRSDEGCDQRHDCHV
jgi:signal transduction histidine kinase